MARPPPLVVTATFDDGSADWFEDLRRAHYPAERNRVPAHLTLFHALPGEQEAAVGEALKAACRAAAPMEAEVLGRWSLGRGVAYRLSSGPLEALRAGLAETFAPWLTRQDRAPWRPHVTVQNKVEPAEAAALLERLQLEFEPFAVRVDGLTVWRYMDGPWAFVARLPFGGA